MTNSSDSDGTSPIQEMERKFAIAIQQGMDVLMNQCGYSRERATMILLREIQRPEQGSKRGAVAMFMPTDDDMFRTMETYGVGIEEATRALIVRNAFRREMLSAIEQRSETGSEMPAIKAIERLISRVSLENLLYESDSSVDMGSDGEDDRLAIRPDLRIEPVSSNASFSSIREKKKSKRRGKNNKNCDKIDINDNYLKGSSKQDSPSSFISGRKRKIDDVSEPSRDEGDRRKKSGHVVDVPSPDTDPSSTTRQRSDSVSSVVDAKFTAVRPVLRSKRPSRSTSCGTATSDHDAEACSTQSSSSPCISSTNEPRDA